MAGDADPRSNRSPGPFVVVLQSTGISFIAANGATLLSSALAAGANLPSACRNGTCRRCLCHLLDGQVVHSIEWPGLSAEEKSAGYILPCVAIPLSDLTLDYRPDSGADQSS